MSLGRKKNIDNAEWIYAMKNIEKTISAEYMKKLEKSTVEEIQNTVRGKRVAYAWSGGKDSIVLAAICSKAGIKPSFFVYCDLEYPKFLEWCLSHKPEGCKVINTGHNLEWLSEHTDMLFPRECKVAYKWYKIIQQNGIQQYYKNHQLDMVIVGHRTADGNYVGKSGSNISINTAGVRRYSPLAKWSHEEILAYIHYNNLSLPPIYGWRNGYKCGTHPWPARQYTGSVKNGFQEVYEIDASIVEDAAKVLPEAKSFISEVAK